MCNLKISKIESTLVTIANGKVSEDRKTSITNIIIIMITTTTTTIIIIIIIIVIITIIIKMIMIIITIKIIMIIIKTADTNSTIRRMERLL